MRGKLSDEVKKSRLLPLNETQTQMVLGTLMGDGSMHRAVKKPKPDAKHRKQNIKSPSPRYYTTHGLCQKAYCEHKAEVLKGYVNVPVKERENKGWGQTSVVFSTLTTPSFDWVYDLVYPDGKKRVTQAWLDLMTIEAIAWWFQDDGSGYPNRITFSTHGFSHEECSLLASWLTNMGYDAHERRVKKKSSTYWVVSLLQAAAWKLQEDMRPHIQPSMTYKLNVLNPIQSYTCNQCGETFPLKTTAARGPSVYCSDGCRRQATQASKRRWNEQNKDSKNEAERERYRRDLEVARAKKREQAAAKRVALEKDPQAKSEHLVKRRQWREKNKDRPEVKAAKAAQDKAYQVKVATDQEKKAEQAEKRREARRRRMADPEYREKIRQQQIARRATRTPEQIEEDRRKNRERMRSSTPV